MSINIGNTEGNYTLNQQYPYLYSGLSFSGNSLMVNAAISISSSSTVNSMVFNLVRIDPVSGQQKWKYWWVRCHKNSGIAYSSIDITSDIINYSGSKFRIIVKTYSGVVTNEIIGSSSTAGVPSGGANSVQYYFEPWYSSQVGIFTNTLIYPTIYQTIYFTVPRKILFKIDYAPGNTILDDIDITFISSNTTREYSLASNPGMFEIRHNSGNGWSTLTPPITVDDDGVYVAFTLPDSINNNISNIQITSYGGNSRSEMDTLGSGATFKDDIDYEDLYVSAGNIIRSSNRSNLINAINRFNNAYANVHTVFGLNPSVSMSGGEFIDFSSFRTQLMDFRNLCLKLYEVFPGSYNQHNIEIVEDMYMSNTNNEIIQANLNDPSSSANGNFFNNLIWIMKNIL